MGTEYFLLFHVQTSYGLIEQPTHSSLKWIWKCFSDEESISNCKSNTICNDFPALPLIIDAKSLMRCIKQSSGCEELFGEAAIEPDDIRNSEEVGRKKILLHIYK